MSALEEGSSRSAAREAARMVKEFGASMDDVKASIQAGTYSAQQFAEEMNKLGPVTTGVIAGIKLFSTAINAVQTAYKASADLIAGNVDELVDLYNAQINVIRTQNVYTQAKALEATALKVYGAGTEQATRATTAAHYVGALYAQSKKNESVAMMEYTIATAKNTATIASSFSEMILAFQAFNIAQTVATVNTVTNAQKMWLMAIPIIGLVAGIGMTAYGMYQTATATQIAPSRQFGGYISRTGPYMLHQGETVVPKEGGGVGGAGMPGVTINIHATSNVDLARVRQEVEAALAKTLLQSQRQRGVY